MVWHVDSGGGGENRMIEKLRGWFGLPPSQAEIDRRLKWIEDTGQAWPPMPKACPPPPQRIT
jgi:hypothetical protein